MKFDKDRCRLEKGVSPIYYWIGNPYVFFTNQAGSNVLIQKVFTDLKFQRLVLDLKYEPGEYQSGAHEYLLQNVEPEWRTMLAIQDRKVPILLSSATTDDIDIGLVHVPSPKDRKRIHAARNAYWSLKDLI